MTMRPRPPSRVLTPSPPLRSGEGGRRDGFVVTDHALDRFFERYDGPDALRPDACERRLLAELERGVLFGGQVGDGELYLLPCGLVAAVVRGDGCRIVKTVLTRAQAIANMESQGAILRGANLRRAS